MDYSGKQWKQQVIFS